MRKILILILLFTVQSCNNRVQFKRDIKSLQSSEIKLPLENMKPFVKGQDTLLVDFIESDLKYIVYSNSSNCNSCSIENMYLWYEALNKVDKYNGRLKFYFLFSPSKQDIKEVKIALKMNYFDYPLFLDTLGEFERLNPHLPKNPQLHSFLLDENNKVILVGNPLYNKQV